MSDFAYCTKCGDYALLGFHRCKPEWECRMEETSDDGDWSIVHAYDPESAAESFAEHYDRESAEYSIVGGSEAIVLVRKPHDPDSTEPAPQFERWIVSGQTVPQYRAAKAA